MTVFRSLLLPSPSIITSWIPHSQSLLPTGAPNHDMCSLPAAPKQTGLSPPCTPRLSRHCREVWLWPLSPLHCGPCFSLSTICSSHSFVGVIPKRTPKETSISGTVSWETQPQTVPILLLSFVTLSMGTFFWCSAFLTQLSSWVPLPLPLSGLPRGPQCG